MLLLRIATAAAAVAAVAGEGDAAGQPAVSSSVLDVAVPVGPVTRRLGGGCLEAEAARSPGSPPDNGSNAFVWACEAGTRWQDWAYSTATGQLRSDLGGLCLGVQEPALAGSRAQMWSCVAGLAAQQWDYDESTGLLRSRVGTGQCLGTDQWGLVHLLPCAASDAQQQWALGPPPATPSLISQRHGVCVDLGTVSGQPDKVPHMWKCYDKLASQRWSFDPKTHQIRSKDGTCLDSIGSGSLGLRACDSQSLTQRWQYYGSNGAIMSFAGGCLATQQPGTNGASLSMEPCSSSSAPAPSQEWTWQP